MAAEFLGLVAIAAVIMAGILFCVGRAANSGSDLLNMGPAPTHEQRQEVERADCKMLIQLRYQYTPNGDSVNPDMTLLRLTRERLADLHCSLPLDLRPN